MVCHQLRTFGAFHLVCRHLGERGGGVKSSIHFHCTQHAKREEGVQIACKIAYVLNVRPLFITLKDRLMWMEADFVKQLYSRHCILYINRMLVIYSICTYE